MGSNMRRANLPVEDYDDPGPEGASFQVAIAGIAALGNSLDDAGELTTDCRRAKVMEVTVGPALFELCRLLGPAEVPGGALG